MSENPRMLYRQDQGTAVPPPAQCSACVAKDAEIAYLRGVVADQAAALRAVAQNQNGREHTA